MFELQGDGIAKWINQIRRIHDPSIKIGSIIMNADPFTLGHLHLVTYASKNADQVYVFVLSSNSTLFSSEVRLRMVQDGCVQFSNVTVISADNYCISAASFPDYYLKTGDDSYKIFAELDATLFARRIAPQMGITVRFLGEELNDSATEKYNHILGRILPAYGVKTIIIPRMTYDGKPIQAGQVREAYRNGEFGQYNNLVPATTTYWMKKKHN